MAPSLHTMQTPRSESSIQQPRQVCAPCKTRKRKCNKALPKCSSCAKSNLTCEYSRPEQDRNSASAADLSWYGSPLDDDRADVQSIDLPTTLFLDPGILQHGQVELSRPANPVPTHVMHLLGDMNEIRITASKYFEQTHLWMPFISKKRFYDNYLRPSFQSRPDVVLLLLSLRLITTLPPTSPRNSRTPLYHAVKHFYLEVEGSSILSILVLQAGVLLALYELGHAIYPAAYLSIGACAHYGHALGINANRRLNIKRVLTLIEVEERRRVWWAIVILDRFVSIGCPGRPFATTNPTLDDFLPADDASWDQGIVRLDDSFTLSSPMTGHMNKFALLCQAARLLGQVLEHITSDLTVQDNAWMQLDRTLQSMLTASLDVDLPDYDQITFVYSALVALHTPGLSGSISIAHTERSQRARAVIQQITERIRINMVEQQCFLGRNTEDIPPWGLFFAYRICVEHIHAGRENPDSSEVVRRLRETFFRIDVRWNVAGVYLQLLEAHEVIDRF